MDPTFDAFLRSWPLDLWFLFALLVTAALYLRGWLVLNRCDGSRWLAGRLAAFGTGLLTLLLALCSPIETFTSLLLQVHMLQHLLLLLIAPPLLWLGAPAFPMLLGLPRPVRTYWITPIFRRASSVERSGGSPIRCQPGCCSPRPPGSGMSHRLISSP